MTRAHKRRCQWLCPWVVTLVYNRDCDASLQLGLSVNPALRLSDLHHQALWVVSGQLLRYHLPLNRKGLALVLLRLRGGARCTLQPILILAVLSLSACVPGQVTPCAHAC